MHLLIREASLLLGNKVSLLLGPDTKFIRKGYFLAIKTEN